jgi:hypothetical protein
MEHAKKELTIAVATMSTIANAACKHHNRTVAHHRHEDYRYRRTVAPNRPQGYPHFLP